MSRNIAIISDVHGNYPALMKALIGAKIQGADGYIFAGDYCLSGAWPDKCIEVLREIPNAKIIRGNEEAYIERLIGGDQSTWTDGQMQISYWNYRNIKEENRDFVLGLPHKLQFDCNGVRVNVAHSSAEFLGDLEFGLFGPAVLAKHYENNVTITPEQLQEYIQNILDGDEAFQKKVYELEDGIYIFGHSHVQWSYLAKGGKVLLINPGSCGLPLDGVRDTVPFSMLKIEEDGSFAVSQKRPKFGVEEYAELLKQSGQYAEARVWTEVILKELLTGREHLTFFLQFADRYATSIGDSVRPFTVKTWEAAYEEWCRTL